MAKLIKHYPYRQAIGRRKYYISEDHDVAWHLWCIMCRHHGVEPDNHSAIVVMDERGNDAIFYYSNGELLLCDSLVAGDGHPSVPTLKTLDYREEAENETD